MQYEIVLRRAMAASPDKERKWLSTTTEQPDLPHAVAYVYHQLTKTAVDNVRQVSSIVIRAPLSAPSPSVAPTSTPLTAPSSRKKGK